MIAKWYEIICDTCGYAERFQGNLQLAERLYRENGGIVTKDRKHYCGKHCYKKRMETNENE